MPWAESRRSAVVRRARIGVYGGLVGWALGLFHTLAAGDPVLPALAALPAMLFGCALVAAVAGSLTAIALKGLLEAARRRRQMPYTPREVHALEWYARFGEILAMIAAVMPLIGPPGLFNYLVSVMTSALHPNTL